MKTIARRLLMLSLLLVGLPAVADLADGLVLHYTFDADEGTTVTDQSGTGNHGVVSGATWSADGVLGGAMHFDGDWDYIRVPNDPSLEPTSITVACWVRMNRLDVDQGLVFKKNPLILYHEDYDLCYFSDRTYNLTLSRGQNLQYAAVTGPLAQTGVWCHVAATFSQPDIRIYVNGLLEGLASFPFPLYHEPTRDVLIGAKDQLAPGSPLHLFLDGDLDDVRIYNRDLTPGEVLMLYQGGPAGPCVTFVGFSNDPGGDQDVTEFLNDETLYVYVRDADLDALDPNVQVQLKLQGKALNAKGKVKTVNIQQNLAPMPDGGFQATIPLDQFVPCEVKVDLSAKIRGRGFYKLLRNSAIFINPAP